MTIRWIQNDFLIFLRGKMKWIIFMYASQSFQLVIRGHLLLSFFASGARTTIYIQLISFCVSLPFFTHQTSENPLFRALVPDALSFTKVKNKKVEIKNCSEMCSVNQRLLLMVSLMHSQYLRSLFIKLFRFCPSSSIPNLDSL